MAEVIKLAEMAGVMQITLTLSGAPGDCIYYLTMYHS